MQVRILSPVPILKGKQMKLVCISDTHGFHDDIDVPDGDILIHAGDMTERGGVEEVEDFNRWLGKLPHKYKIVIAGNHDLCFENSYKPMATAILSNCIYLEHESYEVEGIKFFGTPYQPWFYDWAFNIKTEERREELWSQIPNDTDVLIVHGPPYLHGDQVMGDDHVGCKMLLKRIKESSLKLVVAGHIHEDYGKFNVDETLILNASTCDYSYKPVNPPIVVAYNVSLNRINHEDKN